MMPPRRPTSAFVLGAGLGSRMRPLTEHIPKPMVSLAGRALIDHVLDRLAAAGVTHAVVNVHYLADALIKHLAARTTPQITISDERDGLLDTGGGVARALHHFHNQPFFIHNSDSVWIEDGSSVLDAMISAWDDARMDSLMLLAPAATSVGYDGRGDFAMQADGTLVRAGHDTSAPYVFAGVSIAHPRLFANAPTGAFSLNRLWDAAIARQRVFGIELDGLWMHVGTPTALCDAERAMIAAGKTREPSRIADGEAKA
ncbi:MAG: nucleotidyltransferase family protein [Hyphomicrobium sp.]|nr:nucleotidyltransferase family protein [Hyphomicrobium sp.]